MSWPSQPSAPARRPLPRKAGAIGLLFVPALVLVVSSAGKSGVARSIDVGIAVFLALEALFLINRFGAGRAAGSWLLCAFYVSAFAVLRFNSPDLASPVTQANLAAMLLIPVGVVVWRELGSAMVGNVRNTKLKIRRLLAVRDWPELSADYRSLPVVQEVRKAVRENAAPVLPLLAHPDVHVQLAALVALECQPDWKKGQAEAVIHRANITEEPTVRAAAVVALANVYKPRHLVCLLPFLRDRVAEVRRAAALAILWDARNRWPEIRGAVRLALSDAHAAKDGPLPCSGQLPPAALEDLVGWSCQAGPIGRRATQTLLRHCKKALQEDGSAEAVGRVVALVTNAKGPPGLRVELAHKLQAADEFPVEIAARLVAPTEPTMLRLMAASALLVQRDDPQAVAVLRDAARQPNRQIALTAAGMIQRFLGVDMGLAVGGELPDANSRQAAEVARRVTLWAADPAADTEVNTRRVVPESEVAHF